MNSSTNVTTKLSILIVFAIVFGATMVGLSMKDRNREKETADEWEKTKTLDRTFTVKSGDKLILDADEGDIHVAGTDGQEMTVHIYQKGSEEYISKYRVSFDQAGDIVTIRGRHERKFFHFFDDISYGVRYEIQLPKDFNLNIQTSGGDLHVERVNGTIRGETSGGDVDGENLDGKVTLSTSGGNMKLYHSRGDVVLETSGGDIACDDVVGTMHVETSGGNIKFTKADGELHGTTSGGNIRVELVSNKGVDLSTSGGNVVVSLPKEISANVNAETTGGEVSCDFSFSGKQKDGSLHAKINGGGETIKLESSGGDIEIHAIE